MNIIHKVKSWLWDKFGKDDPDVQNARPEEFGDDGFGTVNPIRAAGNSIKNAVQTVGNKAQELWEDYTGQTQISDQLQANKQLAAYQAQMQEEFYNKYSSPAALMAQYKAAGLNPNLIYSGAGSGQGNVPSYQSPSAPRNLSMADKINSALSGFSQILSMKNLVYQTVANREAAEQAGIRTLSELQNLRRKSMDNDVQSEIFNFEPTLGVRSFFGGSSLGRRIKSSSGSFGVVDHPAQAYVDAMRQITFNRAIDSMYKNKHQYGFYSDGWDTLSWSPDGLDFWQPRATSLDTGSYYQAQQRRFNYNWDQEFKTMYKSLGAAGQLGAFILRALK